MKHVPLAVLSLLFVNPAIAETSESLRTGKTFAVMLGAGIRTPQYREGTLYGSYFIDANAQVMVSLAYLQASIAEAAQEVDGKKQFYLGVTTEVEGSAFAASYRRFFTDSFYVEGGWDFETAEAEFRIDKNVVAADADLTADVGRYQKLSVMIEVGNQWQWEHISIGCSWIGALVPLAQSYTFNTDEFVDGTPKSVKTFQKAATELQATLVRAYLGWSF